MKKLLLTAVVVIASLSTNAQGRFSGGLELGLPVGDYSEINSLGIGVSARYEYPVADKISIIGTFGLQSFGGKKIEGLSEKTPSTTLIPIQAGAKYYFQEAWGGFYGAAELGLNIFSFDGGSETKFGFAPGVGYCVNQNIDIGLRYQMIPFEGGFSFDFLGVRAAYVFGGK